MEGKKIVSMDREKNSVEINGAEYKFTGVTQIDNNKTASIYAKDLKGFEVRVYWDILPSWLNGDQEDMSESCDWDKPYIL